MNKCGMLTSLFLQLRYKINVRGRQFPKNGRNRRNGRKGRFRRFVFVDDSMMAE